jgi:hypothetical protein
VAIPLDNINSLFQKNWTKIDKSSTIKIIFL